MTDEIPEALRFDTDELAAYETVDFQRFMREQPDLYLNHLRIARHLTGWSERLRGEVPVGDHTDFANALDEVAAHLRLGSYLEGGAYL
jgi:hypothetical protein